LALYIFAKRLRAYRKLKSLTQEEFSAAVGVSVAVAGGWERGTREPSNEQLERIIKLLCVSRGELGLSNDTPQEEGW